MTVAEVEAAVADIVATAQSGQAYCGQEAMAKEWHLYGQVLDEIAAAEPELPDWARRMAQLALSTRKIAGFSRLT